MDWTHAPWPKRSGATSNNNNEFPPEQSQSPRSISLLLAMSLKVYRVHLTTPSSPFLRHCASKRLISRHLWRAFRPVAAVRASSGLSEVLHIAATFRQMMLSLSMLGNLASYLASYNLLSASSSSSCPLGCCLMGFPVPYLFSHFTTCPLRHTVVLDH